MNVQVAELTKKLTLPEGIKLSVINLSPLRDRLEEPGLVKALSRVGLQGASEKRQAEFLGGRLCVARSLRAMEVNTEFPLPMKERLPVWPSNVIGSISHCPSLAVAVTAFRKAYITLGIDVETLINTPSAQDIKALVCNPQELSLINSSHLSGNQLLTLIFSAKETLFKALWPITRRHVDFFSAELTSLDEQAVCLRLTQNWNKQWNTGTEILIPYAWVEKEVFTVMFVPRSLKREQSSMPSGNTF